MDISLGCGKSDPIVALRIVLRDPLPVGIHEPEVILRPCLTLFSGSVIPTHRLMAILWDPLPRVIQHTEIVLRTYVAVFGQIPQLLRSLAIIALLIRFVCAPIFDTAPYQQTKEGDLDARRSRLGPHSKPTGDPIILLSPRQSTHPIFHSLT